MLSEEKIIEFYNAYSKELFAYLFRIIGNRNDAEDILHDCFANFIEYSKRHDVQLETVKPFLYRSAHNRAINHMKMAHSREVSINDSISAHNCRTITEQIELQEIENALNNAILRLEPSLQSVFILRKELAMHISEIAENLGISEKTVRRKLEKATRFIINELKKQGFSI